MYQWLRLLLGGAALMALTPGSTMAQTVSALALLRGGDVAPNRVLTAGVGVAEFTVDLAKGEIAFEVTLFDLATRVTGAHIHVGSENVVGPTVFDLRPMSQSGDVTLKSRLTLADVKLVPDLGIRTAADAFKSLVLAGGYVDVHTERNGEGEIRGQIVPMDVTSPSVQAFVQKVMRWRFVQ